MPLVYSITSPSGKVYIGSTVKSLAKRRSVHKNHYSRWVAGTMKRACTARILFEEAGFDACRWDVLEECDISELRIRERHYIETLSCVNRCRPCGTISHDEHLMLKRLDGKKHYAEHKEEKRAYYEAHRVEILEKAKVRYHAKKAATPPPASETTS